MSELELRHLRLVCAIADEPSLTRAAARLGVSQPALSATLQRVERRIGGQVFERSHTGMRVTEFGAYLVGAARVVLADMDNLLAGASARSRQTSSELRIGACPGAVGPGLARRLGEVFPGREVTLQVAAVSRIAADLDGGRLDFAVLEECAGYALPVSDRIDRRQLVAEPVRVALPETHPLRARSEVALADLVDEDWVVAPMRDGNDQLVLGRACSAAGFTPRIRHEVNEPATSRELIVAGAVALAAPSSRNGNGIVIRRLQGNPIVLEHWLAWDPASPHAGRAGEVYRYAAQVYFAQLDRNPDYRTWWHAHPEAHRGLSTALDDETRGPRRPAPAAAS